MVQTKMYLVKTIADYYAIQGEDKDGEFVTLDMPEFTAEGETYYTVEVWQGSYLRENKSFLSYNDAKAYESKVRSKYE